MSKSLRLADSNLSRPTRLVWIALSLAFYLAMIFSIGEPAGAVGGDLDTSFDPGTGADGVVNTTAVQADGKIIIGGGFNTYNGTTRKYLARLNANGTLDTSLDPGEGANSNLIAITLQPDGRIIIAGFFTHYNGISRNGIARLMSALGTVTFSSSINSVNEDGGSASIRLSRTGETETTVTAKVILTDRTTSTADYILTPSALDTSFAPGTGADNYVLATAVQADGKIIIGGQFTSYKGISRNHIARLNTDGSLDTTFNPGTGADSVVHTTAVQPDGKIIIGGGFTHYKSAARNHIVRLNANGSLDESFDPGTGADGVINTTAVQADGKIIIGGDFTHYDGTARNHIARLNANGSLDEAFDPGAGADGVVNTTAVQPDGKTIIGGGFASYNGTSRDGIGRIDVHGSLDASFDPGTGAESVVNTTAVQPDGKIIIGGQFTSYKGISRNHIARLNANGSLDTTFDPGTGADNYVLATAVQADGKIIIGGGFTAYQGAPRSHIARLDGDLFVTWPAGDAADKIIQLPIVDDSLHESNETLTVTLTTLSGGATPGAHPTQTLTILDNDNTAPVADSQSASTSENVARTITLTGSDADNDSLTFTVVTNPSHGTLSGTAANRTYTPTANYSGPDSFTFKVNDGRIGSANATVSITVNEGDVLQPSGATYSVNEGTRTATITVTRTGGSAGPASVKYNTANASASGGATCANGVDYLTATGTLSWADGDRTNKTFTVQVCNDLVSEGSESVNLSLSNVTGSASLGAPSAAVLTIVDNETLPKLSINSLTVTEGNTGTINANFTVKLSGASSKTVTVKYATVNGTAIAPADYTAIPQTVLTFTPGQVSRQVTVAVNGDTLDELNETFKVVLTNPVNAAIAVSQGVCTISDNDPTPSLRINNVTVAEGNAGTTVATFTVSLSAASGQTVTVKYATANGTATSPTDYTAIGLTTLTFGPGQTTRTIKVSVRGETLTEAGETFLVNLSGAVKASIADAQGQGTIINDD